MLAVVIKDLRSEKQIIGFADGQIYKSTDKLLIDMFLHHKEIFIDKNGHIGEFYNRLKDYKQDYIGRWDNEFVEFSMWYYQFDNIIAYITDKQEIVINNSEYFISLVNVSNDNSVEYISAAEYATLHDKTPTQIRRLCSANRIPGVRVCGKTFLIPRNAPYPTNRSITNGQYIQHKK